MARALLLQIAMGSLLAVGCGTTQSNMATQQLLMSDAVDRAVAKVDFRALSGQKVFFDDRFIQNVKGLGFVNSEYFVSALRQQMLAAGCELQEKVDDADYVVEGRVGALATDGHDLTYGLPASKSLSSGLSALPNVPDIPTIPEISFARRSDQIGAAKITVYAFDRKTRAPIWQSGTAVAMSDARNSWVLGVGPFQTGTIYKAPRFAGERLLVPWQRARETPAIPGLVPIGEAYTFLGAPDPTVASVTDQVSTANHETTVASPANVTSPTPDTPTPATPTPATPTPATPTPATPTPAPATPAPATPAPATPTPATPTPATPTPATPTPATPVPATQAPNEADLKGGDPAADGVPMSDTTISARRKSP